MILYTPLPVEDVLAGFEKEAPELIELSMYGTKLLLEQTGLTEGKIHRIISTEPQDYLRPELQPGNIITFLPLQQYVD